MVTSTVSGSRLRVAEASPIIERLTTPAMRHDFTTLKLFLAVVEERSIGKAAEREHISAPAISKRIIELEQSLGVTLLERQNVGVRLTPAGAALAVEVREVLFKLDRMKSTLSEYASGELGRVKIFFSPSGQVGSLPQALKSFMAEHPRVEVYLEERRAAQVIHGVAQGDGDIGIFARHAVDPSDSAGVTLNVQPYETLRLAVVVHRDHPLASLEQTSFAEALQHDFVSFGETSGLGELLRVVAAAQGLTLKSRLKVTTFDSARRMIQAGLGIAVMSELSAKPYIDAMDIRCIPLTDEWAEYHLDICTRTTEVLSKAARLMLARLINAATTSSTDQDVSCGLG